MLTAREIGEEVRLIDQPTERLLSGTVPESGPIALGDDTPLDNGDFVAALCARTGCREGFELWDHLFESPLGQPGW